MCFSHIFFPLYDENWWRPGGFSLILQHRFTKKGDLGIVDQIMAIDCPHVTMSCYPHCSSPPNGADWADFLSRLDWISHISATSTFIFLFQHLEKHIKNIIFIYVCWWFHVIPPIFFTQNCLREAIRALASSMRCLRSRIASKALGGRWSAGDFYKTLEKSCLCRFMAVSNFDFLSFLGIWG